MQQSQDICLETTQLNTNNGIRCLIRPDIPALVVLPAQVFTRWQLHSLSPEELQLITGEDLSSLSQCANTIRTRKNKKLNISENT